MAILGEQEKVILNHLQQTCCRHSFYCFGHSGHTVCCHLSSSSRWQLAACRRPGSFATCPRTGTGTRTRLELWLTWRLPAVLGFGSVSISILQPQLQHQLQHPFAYLPPSLSLPLPISPSLSLSPSASLSSALPFPKSRVSP